MKQRVPISHWVMCPGTQTLRLVCPTLALPSAINTVTDHLPFVFTAALIQVTGFKRRTVRNGVALPRGDALGTIC